MKAELPKIDRRSRRILWLRSVAGKQGGGIFGSSHYAASKAAVIGLCWGLPANSVLTGSPATPCPRASWTRASSPGAAARQRRTACVPLWSTSRRCAEPPRRRTSPARGLYLASDAAVYVTGGILDVNGGPYFD